MAIEFLRKGLIKALGGYVSREDAERDHSSYLERVPVVDLPEDTAVTSHEVRDYLRPLLVARGFTRGQRIAVSRALGKTDFAVTDKRLTIGDVRRMSDEEITSLKTEYSDSTTYVGQKTLIILRGLFGREE